MYGNTYLSRNHSLEKHLSIPRAFKIDYLMTSNYFFTKILLNERKEIFFEGEFYCVLYFLPCLIQ